MTSKEARINLYTTATYVYDMSDTECLNPRAGQTASGHTVRLVSIHPDDLSVQRGIYVSNLESAYTEHDWKVEQQFGNVVVFKSVAVA